MVPKKGLGLPIVLILKGLKQLIIRKCRQKPSLICTKIRTKFGHDFTVLCFLLEPLQHAARDTDQFFFRLGSLSSLPMSTTPGSSRNQAYICPY